MNEDDVTRIIEQVAKLFPANPGKEKAAGEKQEVRDKNQRWVLLPATRNKERTDDTDLNVSDYMRNLQAWATLSSQTTKTWERESIYGDHGR